MSQFFTDEWAQQITGKHRSTIRRWRQAGRFPPALERLADLELEGELGLIHNKWEGWLLNRKTGELVAPGGWTFMPGELLAVPIRLQQIEELKRRAATQPEAHTLFSRLSRWLSPSRA